MALSYYWALPHRTGLSAPAQEFAKVNEILRALPAVTGPVRRPTRAHLSVFYASTGFPFDSAAASPVVVSLVDFSGINVKLPGSGRV